MVNRKNQQKWKTIKKKIPENPTKINFGSKVFIRKIKPNRIYLGIWQNNGGRL